MVIIRVIILLALFWCTLVAPQIAFPADESVYIEKISYPKAEKGIALSLQLSDKGFKLMSSRIVGGYPNYFPGRYEFCARIYSFNGDVLGEYGFSDPRQVYAEQGYAGPNRKESADFILIVPYFENAKMIKIYSGHKELLSVDI